MPSRNMLANAIRALSMDAVQQANSGHPGMPLGMADIAQVLWSDHLRHNPENPDWPNRDRFILSNGHGSMLHYALLHLSGYDLSIDDLRAFRQLHSKTPGHPEYGDTPGVETTTGPLGQGLANGVGMAIAERALAAQFNTDQHCIVNHHTYVLLGDGCLMEGISHEACSLAGTLGLGKLICLYDDNGISIDGDVRGWFTEDIPKRFQAYGWQVLPAVDGHDPKAIDAALRAAKDDPRRPSLICCKTVIGRGAPNKQGTAASHGAPLGEAEIEATREALNWPWPAFEIPQDIRAAWDARGTGRQREAVWREAFAAYAEDEPERAAEFERRLAGRLPPDWPEQARRVLTETAAGAANVATRKASEMALEQWLPLLPEMLGGSADLSGSNNTRCSSSTVLDGEHAGGNYLEYGVREFAMSALMNGLALHGGFLPYAGTFLVFSDYARNALRMAALMKLRCIFVYSHDSIGLGEDGPTHQAVEHTASLRLLPNMHVWRPCDAVETAVAWQVAIERSDGPSCLLLSRQGLPHQNRNDEQLRSIRRGGHILLDCEGQAEAILIATGSEVSLAVDAWHALTQSGRRVLVVSMPCVEIFAAQDEDYRQQVLPAAVTARVSVEAGVTSGWHRYTGDRGIALGVDQFGASAPYLEVFELFGLSAAHVTRAVQSLLDNQS